MQPATYNLESLPWLQAPRAHFNDAIIANRVTHASLVAIDQAMGGHILAQQMAQDILCEQNNVTASCGVCKSCQLIKAGSHPDLHTVKPDGHQIKVDQIRQLCTALTHTAQQGGYRVAVIENAEKLNLPAANALLKTLEEPGQDILLVLQTDHKSQLLPTITSRCQLLSFVAPSRQTIRQWLAQQPHISQALASEINHDVTWCLSVVGGPIALAESIHSQRYQSLLSYRKDWAKSVQQGYLEKSLATINENQIIDALNVFYLYLRQYVLKSTKLTPFIKAKIVELAAEVMKTCQKLSMMSNINCPALCQQYVLSFRHLTLS